MIDAWAGCGEEGKQVAREVKDQIGDFKRLANL